MSEKQRAEIVPWPDDPTDRAALIQRAVGLLRSGEVVAFPTDTVYGIAADTWNDDAVRRLYAIKERPAHKAIALLLSGLSQLTDVTECDSPALRELAVRYWPGGLTIVVPWRQGVRVAGEQPLPTVGVRVPDHPIALALIAEMAIPLATTSANLSGGSSAVTAQDVARQIGDRLSMIIDGGVCAGGRDSTVIDLTTDPPTVRRVGAVSIEQLRGVLGGVQVAS